MFEHPLIEAVHGRYQVFYVPWNISLPTEKEQRRLFQEFVAHVSKQCEQQRLGIRLERHECLLIDNRRMLHGRGPLPDNSRRHLVRLYVRTAKP